MTEFLAEVVGTALLILLGGGVVANVVLNGTKGNSSGWIVITTGWALAVFVGVVVAGPYSGAHLNPAVSIALAVAGKFAWAQVPCFILAQFIGAGIGSFIVWLIHIDHFNATEDPNAQLAVFSTAPAIRNYPINLVSEFVGGFVLVFVILHLKGAELQGINHVPIGLGAVGAIPVAFLVWVIGLSLGGTTGYAINPARDLGPRIMHAILPIKNKRDSDWAYAWIPVLGPILGGAIASFLCCLNF
ncbi:MAG: MIP/aquaporin family protein [Sphingobacteriaceae bacterium]|jgi:glycerol uptake facilitator protein